MCIKVTKCLWFKENPCRDILDKGRNFFKSFVLNMTVLLVIVDSSISHSDWTGCRTS